MQRIQKQEPSRMGEVVSAFADHLERLYRDCEAWATSSWARGHMQEVEEVVVDFEPWMNDYGREEDGITFDATDQIASYHPEIWLSPEKIGEIKQEEKEREEEEEKKRQKEREKKQKKKQKKEKKAAEKAAKAAANPPKAKGIASKKHEEPVDDVTAAAQLAMQGDIMMEDDLDLGFDFEDLGGEDGFDFWLRKATLREKE